MIPVIIHDLARAVLQKNSLQDCSRDELERMAAKYPYFGVAQLLLAAKLKEENAGEYTRQLQKLSLYIPHPLWLEQLLEQKGDMIIHTTEKKPEVVEEPVLKTEAPPAMAIPDPVIPEPVTEPTEIKTEPILTGTSQELTFEPYHTVDYFASQGIRFREEEQPKDKFGQQLKSFTEWLKTLKRIPAAEVAATVEGGSEQKVEQLAEHSITDREVVTEAMAEVWQKQGNIDKAIATYRKLSLLNPAKSSYFAAKIEQLKTT